MNFNPIILLIFLSALFKVNGQKNSLVQFIENKGQFHEKIDYKIPINAGNVFFEGNCITYNLFEKGKISNIKHGNNTVSPILKGHTYKAHLIGSNSDYTKKGHLKTENYYNFFLGKNPNNWAANVPAYNKIEFLNIYDSINMLVYEKNEHLKYDFILKPSAKTSVIKIFYEGADNISIKNGHLNIKTSIGKVIEQSPYAYQFINGKKTKVKCHYLLQGDTLSFDFPKGYDTTKTLIIDPILIFSTESVNIHPLGVVMST